MVATDAAARTAREFAGPGGGVGTGPARVGAETV